MTDKSFTAEEVRANIAANRRHMTTETELQLTAYADTLSKPADSGRVGDKPAECANGCPPMQVCDFCQDAPVWRAEWAGSAPGRGWYIREGSHLTNAPVVAYLGDNIDKVLVREMVEAHNATVHRDKSLAAQGQGEVACHRFLGPTGEAVTEWDDGLPDNGKRFPDLCPPVSSVQYAYFHPAPPASPAGVPDDTRRLQFVLDHVPHSVLADFGVLPSNWMELLEGEAHIDDVRATIDAALTAAPSTPEGDHHG